MKRDNFTQLPTSAELQEILSKEVKRKLPKGKEEVHYFDFSPLLKLAKHFGLDDDTIVSPQASMESAKVFADKMREMILSRDLSLDDVKILNEVYDYLAEQDPLVKAGLIFVFGAKTPLRIERAIELYQEQFAEKLILSGRSPHYADAQALTEAETYAKIAEESGVPEEKIIIEKESITIPDNVRASLNLLDESKINYNSIILVNSPYTQRRGWAHFKKYLPDTISLIRVNSETGDEYRRDSWYKNAKGIDAILGEYLKAKVAVALKTA